MWTKSFTVLNKDFHEQVAFLLQLNEYSLMVVVTYLYYDRDGSYVERGNDT